MKSIHLTLEKETDMKICPHCKKEIDDESVFCTFCGKEVTGALTKEDTQTQSVQSKSEPIVIRKSGAKKAIVILAVISAILALSLIGTIIYYEHECNIIIARYFDQREKKVQAEQELQTAKAELKKKNDTISAQDKEIEKLKNNNKELQDDGMKSDVKLSQLNSFLKQAKTTNGIISTQNTIYAVRKGETAKIDIVWKKNQTVYMQPWSSVITAEWSATNDVIIKGERTGMTYIIFSTDSIGSKNAFTVAVVCYE